MDSACRQVDTKCRIPASQFALALSCVRCSIVRQYQGDIEQTAELLIADHIAVYAILASGLATNTLHEPRNFGKRIEADDSNRAFNQIAIETHVRDTGGKAFHNSNALNDAMAQAVNAGSHYHTLTYAHHELHETAVECVGVRARLAGPGRHHPRRDRATSISAR